MNELLGLTLGHTLAGVRPPGCGNRKLACLHASKVGSNGRRIVSLLSSIPGSIPQPQDGIKQKFYTAERLAAFGSPPLGSTCGEVDQNGTINIFDLFCVLNGFGGIDPCCDGLP